MIAAVEALATWASALGRLILEASLVGAVFVGLVWLVTRLVPRMPARVRCGLWWLAAAKLLLLLVWTSPVELALLPAKVVAPPPLGASAAALPASGPATEVSAVEIPAPTTSPAATEPGATSGDVLHRRAVPAALGLSALLWLGGALWQLARLGRQQRAGARLRARAEPLDRGPVADLCRRLAGRLGLARTPELRLSDDASSPQAMGAWAPAVVLPRPGLERFSRDEIAMTLCHELAHVRRWDLVLGWVPALAERLFFFHPLAALAAREYSLAREAACDALVVEVLGTAPRDYGRLILRWGVAPRETGLAAASASPSFAILKRRLEMLQQPHVESPRARHRVAWWSAAVVAVLGLVPFTIVAQAPPPAPAAEPAPPATAAVVASVPEAPPAAPGAVETPAPDAPASAGTPAPAPTPNPFPTPVGIAGEPSLPALPAPLPDGLPSPAVAPTPGAHPSSPEPPVTPRVAAVWPGPGEGSPRPSPRSGNTWSYSTSDDGPSYVYLEGDSAFVMNGSWNTGGTDSLRARYGQGPLLLVGRNGERWVIRDEATLAQVRQATEPQTELGAQQGELGERQGELGNRQSELGRQMSQLGEQMGRADRDERDELGDRMRELGDRMRELGERQRELGERQRELGERQREVAERAAHEIERLADRAIESGVAERVD